MLLLILREIFRFPIMFLANDELLRKLDRCGVPSRDALDMIGSGALDALHDEDAIARGHADVTIMQGAAEPLHLH